MKRVMQTSGFSMLEVLITLGMFSIFFWLFAELAQDMNSARARSKGHHRLSQLLSSVASDFSSDVRSAIRCESAKPSSLRLTKIDLSKPRGLASGLPEPLPSHWSPYSGLETVTWELADRDLTRTSSLKGLETLLKEPTRVGFSLEEAQVRVTIELNGVDGKLNYELVEALTCQR